MMKHTFSLKLCLLKHARIPLNYIYFPPDVVRNVFSRPRIGVFIVLSSSLLPY